MPGRLSFGKVFDIVSSLGFMGGLALDKYIAERYGNSLGSGSFHNAIMRPAIGPLRISRESTEIG